MFSYHVRLKVQGAGGLRIALMNVKFDTLGLALHNYSQKSTRALTEKTKQIMVLYFLLFLQNAVHGMSSLPIFSLNPKCKNK